MSNISLSLLTEKRESQVSNRKNEEKINMGLTYALGPFPDEPLLLAIDKTLLLSSSLRRNSIVQKKTEAKKAKLLNASFGTECPIQGPTKLADISISCPDLSISSEETLKEKIDFSSKASSSSNIVDQCQTSKDGLNRMWVEKKTTQNGIKSYEIWSEEVCKDSPSMIFIVSPHGEVIPFEYLTRE